MVHFFSLLVDGCLGSFSFVVEAAQACLKRPSLPQSSSKETVIIIFIWLNKRRPEHLHETLRQMKRLISAVTGNTSLVLWKPLAKTRQYVLTKYKVGHITLTYFWAFGWKAAFNQYDTWEFGERDSTPDSLALANIPLASKLGVQPVRTTTFNSKFLFWKAHQNATFCSGGCKSIQLNRYPYPEVLSWHETKYFIVRSVLLIHHRRVPHRVYTRAVG